MKYTIIRTSQFKKDYKLAVKRGCNIQELKFVVAQLAEGYVLPDKYHDHSLKGTYASYRECHIEPDWLLVYKVTEELLMLTLYRTGSHSDIFNR